MPKATRRRRGKRVDATGRSKGADSHVRLHHWELNSPAFRSLSLGARALLVELKALFMGTNNGELFLSVREAGRRLGVGKNLAERCFRQLEDRGFIRPNRTGSFNWKGGARRGAATTWILTEFGFAGAIPTKDFMRWRPRDADEVTPRSESTVPVMGTPGPSVGDTGRSNGPKCPQSRDTRRRARPSDGPHGGDTVKLPTGVFRRTG